jgi:branched-chain amino acid transport system permease protein
VLLNDYLATAGFEEIGIVTGTIFIIVVLLFRAGIWGTAHNLLTTHTHRRRATTPPAPTTERQQQDISTSARQR